MPDVSLEETTLQSMTDAEGAAVSRPTELVIKPGGALRLNLRELWAYRELFYFFAWRDIKVRYKQTALERSGRCSRPS